MTALHIHLLGGLNITGDQAPLPLISGAVAHSLFAYLVTYRDQPHTRDLLAGTFWPELPDTAARRRLSQALWRIRHALEGEPPCPPVLLTEGDTVQLDPDLLLWLDVEEFERQVAKGTLPELGAAAELYRGDFLAGYYDDWLLVERAPARPVPGHPGASVRGLQGPG